MRRYVKVTQFFFVTDSDVCLTLAQHQIQTVQHYTSSIDVVNEENNDKDDNEQSLQVIASEIVNNAIITAKNKVHHHL